jgi:pyruvate-formate lyase-activating enzyme
MNVIFYGAGLDAAKNYKKYSEQGLTPVCFADKDERKHGKLFPDNEPGAVLVMSLEKAIEIYKDYSLCPTVSTQNIQAVCDYLLDYGIPEDRIIFPKNIKKGFFCNQLQNTLFIQGDLTKECCNSKFRKTVKYTSISDALEQKQKRIAEITSDTKDGKPTFCEGCFSGEFGFFNDTISKVMISSGFNNDYCNVRCFYCKFPRERYVNNFNLLPIIEQIYEHFQSIELSFANQEFLCNSDADEIIKLINKNNTPISLVTNGTIIRDALIDTMKLGLLRNINCSLDSGTAKTYKKIKGLDLFDIVCKNLEIYHSYGVNLYLKYIMLKECNDNTNDIDNFIQIARKLNAIVELSANYNETDNNLPDKSIEMCRYFISAVKSAGSEFILVREHFNKDDIKLILSEVSV